MSKVYTPGQVFRNLIKTKQEEHTPLQVVGTINAYTSLLAQQSGHEAIYLSGAGVANASFGLPDLGLTTLNDVLEDARRITERSPLPLLVDIDTGFGNTVQLSRCIKEMGHAGVAAVHIEDQVSQKRCGHRPNKTLVSCQEMVDRIKAAVDAREDESFFIMARTDAFANEGMLCALERAQAYIDAGADGLFPEALTKLEDYQEFSSALCIPILANITEFGKTPLFNTKELQQVGVQMALYPLSAFRAMSQAAMKTYQNILDEGGQSSCLEDMQTRQELYEILDYYKYENEFDELYPPQT